MTVHEDVTKFGDIDNMALENSRPQAIPLGSTDNSSLLRHPALARHETFEDIVIVIVFKGLAASFCAFNRPRITPNTGTLE